MTATYRDKLYPLCGRLRQSALEIIGQADLRITARGMADPKILALALLSRTLSNFKAAISLARERMVVEARVMVRCCFENLYMAGGLHRDGDQFAQRMIDDDRAGRKGRIGVAVKTDAIFDSFSPEMQKVVRDSYEAFLAAGKAGYLTPSAASAVGPFKDTYIAYSQFSGDAAHPTIMALSRYWRQGAQAATDKGVFFDIEPEPDEDELDQTLDFACIAMFGVMMTTNEMIGFTEAGKKLLQLNDEMQRLQAERWGSLEAVGEPIDIRTGAQNER